jgi:hypothetical protein
MVRKHSAEFAVTYHDYLVPLCGVDVALGWAVFCRRVLVYELLAKGYCFRLLIQTFLLNRSSLKALP